MFKVGNEMLIVSPSIIKMVEIVTNLKQRVNRFLYQLIKFIYRA